MLNNATGGIVVVGVADDATPAEFDSLCEDPGKSPTFDMAQCRWLTDKWKNWARLKLSQQRWIDRYGSEWQCSIDLFNTSLLSIESGEYLGHPVLLFLLKPSDTPVQLVQRGCLSSCPVSKNRCVSYPEGTPRIAQWCGFPHDHCQNSEKTLLCRHVYKRTDGFSLAATQEWQIDELICHWAKRDSDDFAQLYSREVNQLERQRFLLDDVSIYIHDHVSSIRDNTLRLCIREAEDGVNSLVHSPLVHFDALSSHLYFVDFPPGQTDSFLRLCGRMALSQEINEAIPLVLDMRLLYPKDISALKKSNSKFLYTFLEDRYADTGLSAKAWKDLLDRRAFLFFLLLGNSTMGDHDYAKDIHQTVSFFLCNHCSRKTPHVFFLSGIRDIFSATAWEPRRMSLNRLLQQLTPTR